MESHLLSNQGGLCTEDLDESQAVLGRVWEKHVDTPRDKTYSIRWHQADLNKTSLSYIDHPCAVSTVCEGPSSDVFRLPLHHCGRVEHRISGVRAVSTPTQTVVHAPGQDLRLEIQPFRLLMLSLDGSAVRAALARRFDALPPFETWTTDLACASPRVAPLRSLALWTAHEIDRPGSVLLTTPPVRGQVERTLLSLFVECLAERHPGAAAPVPDLALAQVRRMEEWLDANLGEAVGIDEVAAAIGIGVRSAQQAFARVHGCPPMRWLTHRRLERARDMLDRALPTTTVTDVATACGFFQLGRFAVRYRHAFGEKPSETLARARARQGVRRGFSHNTPAALACVAVADPG